MREPERLAGFVHGIAQDVLASHFRRRGYEPNTVPLEVDFPTPAPEDSHARERWQMALRAVAELPPGPRGPGAEPRPGAGSTEIAARLGLTADTVRMRKMRATRRASELVQGWLRSASSERRYG